MVDPTSVTRFLDLLKASGWQAGCLTVSGIIFLYLSKHEYIPDINGPWLLIVYAFIFVCAALTAAALGNFLSNIATSVQSRISERLFIRRARKEFRAYIPFMTDNERRILSYLLKHKLKTFMSDVDGGHAASLIPRRIIYIALSPGQVFDQANVPFVIPDYVYEEMEANPTSFPFEPDDNGAHPWRVDWMLR